MYNLTNLPLSPLKVVKKSLPAILKSAFVAAIVWFVFFIQNNFWAPTMQQSLPGLPPSPDIELFPLWMGWLVLAMVIAPAVVKTIYEYLYYKLYYYDFSEEQAEIRKGVISRATGYVRYYRLQNVYLDQDFLDRIFGLYDVHFETAGETSGFYSHVDGLQRDNAQKLLNFLIERSKNAPQPSASQLNEPGPEVNQTIKVGSASQITKISSQTHPLAPNLLRASVVASCVFWGAPAFIVYVFVKVAAPAFAATGAVIVGTYFIIQLITFIYMKIFIRNFEFELGPEEGRIRTQVISQSISHFYYNRVQNINVSQGVFDRMFSIYNLAIETAGEISSSELSLPGLRKEHAEEIKAFLVEKSKAARRL